MSNREVKLLTARSFSNIFINDTIKTVRDVLIEGGVSTDDATVRIDGELVTDLDREVHGGETISAFSTKTVASAGVKGAVNYTEMSLIDITKLPGVSDLPTMQKAKFGQALKLEAQGNYAAAEVKLSEAVAFVSSKSN